VWDLGVARGSKQRLREAFSGALKGAKPHLRVYATEYINGDLKRLCSGDTREAFAGNIRYVYLTLRTHNPLVLLSHGAVYLECESNALGPIRRVASATSDVTWPSLPA